MAAARFRPRVCLRVCVCADVSCLPMCVVADGDAVYSVLLLDNHHLQLKGGKPPYM